MKKRPLLAIVLMWFIAIAVSAVVLDGSGYFTKLGPVYFICMIGSILIVRKITMDQE